MTRFVRLFLGGVPTVVRYPEPDIRSYFEYLFWVALRNFRKKKKSTVCVTVRPTNTLSYSGVVSVLKLGLSPCIGEVGRWIRWVQGSKKAFSSWRSIHLLSHNKTIKSGTMCDVIVLHCRRRPTSFSGNPVSLIVTWQVRLTVSVNPSYGFSIRSLSLYL